MDLVPPDPAAPDDVTTVVAERHTHDVLGGPVDRFDDAVDRLWGRVFRGRPGADRVFYLASELGDFSLVWHLIGAAQGLRSDRDADATFRLAAVLLTESLVVNQGIKRLGHGLVANAWAPDGLIEGIEGSNGQFLIAVQWHPEELAGSDAGMRRLFHGFIDAASGKA